MLRSNWQNYFFVVWLGSLGCAHSAAYTWVDALPPSLMQPEPYRINLGDSLAILVWNQSKLSTECKVRQDGQITLPLLGDIAVVGLTPTGAAKQIERRLSGLVVDPKVNVSLRETTSPTYSVVGEIKTSGSYPLSGPVTLLQALAAAGGLTELAHRDSIYVLRKSPELLRIRFDYEKLIKAQGRGVLFQLRDGDVVVVE